MASPAEQRLAPIVRRLALVFALSVAIGLPGGYFVVKYLDHIEHVEITAELKAESLTDLVAANPELWAYQVQRMEELLLRYPPRLVDDSATVRDAAGNPLVTVGVPAHAPVLLRSAPIYESGRVVGQIEVAHSYREVMFGTLFVGLLGLLLGGLIYATVLVLPLRALRRVAAALMRETAKVSASASRYRALAEAAKDAIITADGAGTIRGWNPGAERMFGYTEAEVIGQALTLIMPHRYRAGHVDGIRRIQGGGERHLIGKSVELHGLSKAGREFPIELALSEWETPEGRFFAGIIHDITERKQAELALVREKDLYEMLSQTNQAIVRITSRDELFQLVCRIAVEHGRFRFAWIGLIDKDEQLLKPVARYGEDAGYIDQVNRPGRSIGDLRQGLIAQTLVSGSYVISNDALNDPALAPWREAARHAGVRASAKFPIRQGGAVIGAINLYAGDPGFFTEALVATLGEIANDVSFALDNLARQLALEQASQVLHASEEKFRAIFGSMVDGVVVLDVETGKFLNGNPELCRMLGYTLEEIIGGLGVADIHPEQDLPRIMEKIEQQRRGEARMAADIPVKRKDGSVFYADIKSAHIRVGGKDCLLGVFRDATERKVMEDKLRDSAAFRELLLQAMPLPVFHKDALGRYTGCNHAFTEFIGKTEKEIIGKTVYEVAPQSFAQNYRDKDLELLDDPRGMQVYESRVMHADGTARDVIFHKARIVDGAGRPAGIVGAIADISENKRAQEALREAEAQFRGLVEQSIAGIYIFQNGRIAYANPRYAEIRGYSSAAEVIGLDPLQLTAEKDRSAVAEHFRRLLAGEVRNLGYTFTALRKDGSSVEVGVNSATARFRGRPAVIGLMQDISEKKRAEEQIQHYLEQLKTAVMSTVEVATVIGEMRDPYTAGHQRRVASIAVAIGAELGLDENRQAGLRIAGQLHDIGKVTIPSEILSKPGKLSAIEFELVRGHARASYDVLKGVEWSWPVAEIALQHHERMDGSGYPQGLKGEEILLEARIMSVADVVEAMSSHRPYRPGLGIDNALAEIEHGRGSAYDPVVVDACLRLFREKGYAIPA